MATDEGLAPERRKRRRGYISIVAINPEDGKPWHVLVSHERMDWIYKLGEGHVKQLIDTVCFALLNPRHVFRGVRHEDEIDWYCYATLPPHAYDLRSGAKRTPWPDEVFLVFVNSDRVVYNWRWEKRSLDDRTLPVDHESRFDRMDL